jgi:ferredoxin hydrogenase large subunit
MGVTRRDLLKVMGGTALAAGASSLTSCKKQVTTAEMEKVSVSMASPSLSDYDKVFFVQVDPKLCQSCGTCEGVCPTGAIATVAGDKRTVASCDVCINCGQCLVNCPYGAIKEEVSFVGDVMKALKDKDTVVVAMPAPAVRYAIGEPFGMQPGEYAAGKMFAALRKLGFGLIWDNEYTADVTILEEEPRGNRNRKEKPLPHSPPAVRDGASMWILLSKPFPRSHMQSP